MPQEPKKRHSRQRQGKRRAAIKLAATNLYLCPNCKKPSFAHVVCKNCGYYKNESVIKIKEKKEEK